MKMKLLFILFIVFICLGTIGCSIYKKEKEDNEDSEREKAIRYGFNCTGNLCSKEEYTPGGTPIKYNLNTDEKWIDSYMEFDFGNGEKSYGKAKYWYETGYVGTALYAHYNGRDLFFDYSYNLRTGERKCNYSDMSECAFNIDMAKEVMNLYENIMNS